jgi:hypothetical protein
MNTARWLKGFITGVIGGLVIPYLVASVYRLLSGSPAAKAFVPGASLVGFWAGFGLWVLILSLVFFKVRRMGSGGTKDDSS